MYVPSGSADRRSHLRPRLRTHVRGIFTRVAFDHRKKNTGRSTVLGARNNDTPGTATRQKCGRHTRIPIICRSSSDRSRSRAATSLKVPRDAHRVAHTVQVHRTRAADDYSSDIQMPRGIRRMLRRYLRECEIDGNSVRNRESRRSARGGKQKGKKLIPGMKNIKTAEPI